MKFIITTIILLLFSIQSQSQELKRKGTFGVQMETTDNGEGIRVLKVFENSTASALGLLENDIIVTVNNQKYNDTKQLVKAIGLWTMNDSISLEIIRNNKKHNLKGKVLGKPYETSQYAKVIYGEVDYDGGKLRSILEIPNNIENPPVVFFLPGVGCGSLDYYYDPTSPIKLLVEGLVANGIAVYRVEKPGMGDSVGTKDCLEMDFNYEVAAFNTAAKKLKTIEGIDADNLFLYGHSLGAISAPIIASENEVAGIISWGGISTTWFEYILKTDRNQQVIFGTDYGEIDSNFRESLPFRYDFLVNKFTPEELSKNPSYKNYVQYFVDGKLWYGLHHYTYFQTLNDVNVLSAYKNANCPVLAIAGEYDYHAVDTTWAKEISDAVNFYRPNQGEYIVIPKTSHHYHTVPSVKLYNELRASGKINGAYVAQHFNNDIPLIVANWIKKTK